METSQWWRATKRHPSAALLAAQLLQVVVYPFTTDDGFSRTLLSLFSVVVLALAVRTVRSTPALSWISVVIGVPTIVFTILEAVYPDSDGVLLWSSVLHASFYFYTAYALIRYMFHDDRVTRDEIYATGAAFTVVAWGFTYVFTLIQIIWPGSFTAAAGANETRTWFELLYLSFTTLTSVGLSDIVPIRPHARSVVMLEQLAGVMYLALVVTRLVAMQRTRAGG